MTRRLAPLAAAMVLWALPAAALDISPETYGHCLGAPACRIGAAWIVAEPSDDDARLAEQLDQERGAMAGLGVAHNAGNGFNNPEIQGAVAPGDRAHTGERLVVAFDTPHRVTTITLAHLFNPETVPGDAAEEALVEGFSNGESLGVISVASLSRTTTRLTGPVGQMTEVSPEAGAIMLIGPFVGAPVDRLVFRARGVEAGDTSDYSVARITALPLD